MEYICELQRYDRIIHTECRPTCCTDLTVQLAACSRFARSPRALLKIGTYTVSISFFTCEYSFFPFLPPSSSLPRVFTDGRRWQNTCGDRSVPRLTACNPNNSRLLHLFASALIDIGLWIRPDPVGPFFPFHPSSHHPYSTKINNPVTIVELK